MAESYSTVQMNHIIHSSTDGHADGFYIWMTLKNGPIT
jgi:hypothetical protein